MKPKYELDRWALHKDKALEEINHKLGTRATISGDTVEVDGGSYYEREVEDVLRHHNIKYSRK